VSHYRQFAIEDLGVYL